MAAVEVVCDIFYAANIYMLPRLMKAYVYPTDRNWYGYLSRKHNLDEVNFWRPGGRQPFRQLSEGDLFLFRFGRPDNAIVGGGTFTHFSFAPIAQVWEAFGDKNGTPDFESFLRLIASHRDLLDNPEQAGTAIIGNIVLTAPFFLERDAWFPVPEEYQATSPQGQGYAANSSAGRYLIENASSALRQGFPMQLAERLAPEMRFGTSVVRRRMGQGGFSLVVADAYSKRCAVTGERTYPVLEAAHIVPVARGGAHRPDNGLLLRSDIHKLFDRGYVSIEPSGTFRVSPSLRNDWQNGRVYYDFDGRDIRLPITDELRPAREFLEWHLDTVFKR